MDQIRRLSAAAMVVLCLTHLVTMAHRSMFAAVVPLLGKHYHFSDTALGILLGPAFAATYAIAAIGFGRYADRRPARPLVVTGLMLLTVAAAVTASSDRFGLFFLGQVLLGMGQAALVPAAMLLIVQGTPSRHGVGPPPLSLFTGASALGRSAGFMLAGAVLAVAAAAGVPVERQGWRLLPLVIVISTLVLLLACRRVLRHDPAPSPRIADGGLHRLPLTLIPLLIAAFAPVLIGQSVAAWMPSLLVRMRGFAVSEAASFFGVVLLVMGCGGQVVGGFATQRVAWIARRPVLANAACLVAAEPLLLVATRAGPHWLIAAALAAVLMLVGMAAFIALHAVQAMSPSSRRGTTTGIFLSLVTLVGAGGGPLLTGLLSDSGLTAANGQGLGTALVLVGGGGALVNSLIALGLLVRGTRTMAA